MVHLRRRVDPIRIEHAFERWSLGRGGARTELARHPPNVGTEVTGSARKAAQYLVQHEENGHLHQEWQAATQRIDAVFLIKLQKFFVELLPIVFVPGLNLLHFRLQLLHDHHRARALEGQRRHDDHDDQRQQDDGNGIVPGGVVEERQN